jgi:hypothetical protein
MSKLQVSLYPSMMKYGIYPIRHAQVLTRETIVSTSPLPWTREEQNHWRGFLHVRLLPPRHLLYPLLHYRSEDKRLVFTLCSACAESKSQRACVHSDEERAWIFGYTHLEINRALSLGYKVLDIYEVIYSEYFRKNKLGKFKINHYDEWASLEGGNPLFAGFVNTLVKMKVEASGWAKSGVDENDEEAKAKFCQDYLENEGIEIDPDNMQDNPAVRTLAKITVNR